MKEEKHGENSRNKGKTPNESNENPAFMPRNASDKRNLDDLNAARKLSEPPQRDKSGKRVDIDGNRDFGYEIW